MHAKKKTKEIFLMSHHVNGSRRGKIFGVFFVLIRRVSPIIHVHILAKLVESFFLIQTNLCAIILGHVLCPISSHVPQVLPKILRCLPRAEILRLPSHPFRKQSSGATCSPANPQVPPSRSRTSPHLCSSKSSGAALPLPHKSPPVPQQILRCLLPLPHKPPPGPQQILR